MLISKQFLLISMSTEYCSKCMKNTRAMTAFIWKFFSISFAQILIITTEFFRCDFWNWLACTQTLFYIPFPSYFLLPPPLPIVNAQRLFNNYSSSPNGLWVNSPWVGLSRLRCAPFEHFFEFGAPFCILSTLKHFFALWATLEQYFTFRANFEQHMSSKTF